MYMYMYMKRHVFLIVAHCTMTNVIFRVTLPFTDEGGNNVLLRKMVFVCGDREEVLDLTGRAESVPPIH